MDKFTKSFIQEYIQMYKQKVKFIKQLKRMHNNWDIYIPEEFNLDVLQKSYENEIERMKNYVKNK